MDTFVNTLAAIGNGRQLSLLGTIVGAFVLDCLLCYVGWLNLQSVVSLMAMDELIDIKTSDMKSSANTGNGSSLSLPCTDSSLSLYPQPIEMISKCTANKAASHEAEL